LNFPNRQWTQQWCLHTFWKHSILTFWRYFFIPLQFIL
jgi:hypothetical protein